MQAMSLSPSFSSYSNSKLAEIAARIVDEFDSDEFSDESRENSGEGGVSDEDFEFAIVARDSELSADEIFRNGKIRPVYPVFDRGLLIGDVKFHNENEKENGVRSSVSPPKIRLPLRKLFHEERETAITTSSSSSSESDDLDGVAAENYCLWTPKAAGTAEEGSCKKSSSTGGNSKRWKLRDFLHRSNSDGGKNSFVVLSHSNSGRKKENEKEVTKRAADGGKVKPAPPPPCNQGGGEKQLSYLPYRQDLVGIFGNVNGLKKNLQSFF